MSEQMEKLSNEAEQFDDYRTEQQTSVDRTKQAFTKIVENVTGINARIKQVREAINEVNNAANELQNIAMFLQEEDGQFNLISENLGRPKCRRRIGLDD